MDEILDFHRERKTSKITEEFPDKTKFPLYYEARRQEFTINPGEMLFIPAGWWHFVFSEDPDPETHINFAVNFWYYPQNGYIEGEQFKDFVPNTKKYSVLVEPKDILKDSLINVTRSSTNYITPLGVTFRYDNTQTTEEMTYDEFLSLRDPYSYISQNTSKELETCAPSMNTLLHNANIWINFGNMRSVPHYDTYDNWLCQIQGRKRVVLFPPEDREKLYPINACSLNLINKIMSLGNDQFLMKTSNVLYQDFIEWVRQEPVPDCVPFNTMSETFRAVTQMIKTNLKGKNCFIQNFKEPNKFQVIDVRNSEYIRSFGTGYFYTILWFLTSGKLYIRDHDYTVYEGDCYAFPTSFLYPWKVDNAMFILYRDLSPLIILEEPTLR